MKIDKFLLIIFFLALVCFVSISHAQTPGLIFKPATVAMDIHHPQPRVITRTKGLNVKSPTCQWFFLWLNQSGDLGPGPDCNFTDFVHSGDEDPGISYFDGTNYF